jgi:membrane fusion protein, multidrug efflux system
MSRHGQQTGATGHRMAAASLLATMLAACSPSEQQGAPAPRPVSVALVEPMVVTRSITLTGDIQAQKEIDIGFRIAGRMLERPVNVGDRVVAGQLLARLDAQTEQNALMAAEAAILSAQGEVATARNTLERQESLLARGFTTRPRYDQARTAFETAQARLEGASASVETARDRMGFTELRAGAAGVVTARRIEPGEVVQPGQTVLQIARDDGRDAVFDVPAALLDQGTRDMRIRIATVADPALVAYGRVREVAPQADPVTRTFKVRVGLESPPASLLLGTGISGSVETSSASALVIPAGALTQSGRSPAVWIVDPATAKVSLREIEILRFEPRKVVVGGGLRPGETIVTGGIQALHPGQTVRPVTPTAAMPVRNADFIHKGLGLLRIHAINTINEEAGG